MMDTDDASKTDWVNATVARYAGPLTRYAMLITGEVESARDVVQDTFVKLCAEDRHRLNSHLAPWLFTVCRNRAMDVRRKANKMNSTDGGEFEERAADDPSPAARAEQRETNGQVMALLARLPKNQQEVVRLKFQNGLSYQEISDVTRLTVSHVGVLLHTALKTLRQQLQREQVSQPLPTGGPNDDCR